MKKNALLLIALGTSAIVFAQGKFYTKTGRISFYSSAKLEDITAVNRSVVTLLDAKTGDLQFAVLMKGFEFRKALMQEHFNKSYVESDKYPRSEFKGQIVNNASVNYGADKAYPVTAEGRLTIHGVTKEVSVPGTLTVKNGKVTINAVFNILLADYNIAIPKMYRDNISKSIQITVEETLEPLRES
ncbi:MAG TPA: YceI family protein [Chitinophagaceae bacterium]|nr:YceI family protein [Chitinophagaceae bacterium]